MSMSANKWHVSQSIWVYIISTFRIFWTILLFLVSLSADTVYCIKQWNRLVIMQNCVAGFVFLCWFDVCSYGSFYLKGIIAAIISTVHAEMSHSFCKMIYHLNRGLFCADDLVTFHSWKLTGFNVKVTMMRRHNMLLGHKGKMWWLWAHVFYQLF